MNYIFFIIFIVLNIYKINNKLAIIIILYTYSAVCIYYRTDVYADDIYNYYDHYSEYIKNGIKPLYFNGIEFVLPIIFQIFKYIGIRDFFTFILCIMIIQITMIIYIINKIDKNYINYSILFVIYYPYLFDSNSFIRQSLSSILVVLSLTNQGYKRYLIYSIALFTHFTSLIFLPIFLIKNSKIYFFLLMVCSYLLPHISIDLFQKISNFAGMGDKLYFINQIIVSGQEISDPNLTTFFGALFLIFGSLIFKNKEIKSTIYNDLLSIFMYTITLANFCTAIPYATYRFGLLALELPTILLLTIKSKYRIYFGVGLIFYSVARFYYGSDKSFELNYPYLW